MFNKIYYYLLLSRPKTLIIGFCSVFVSTNFLSNDNENFVLPKWFIVLLCYLTVLFCQISSNVINDYLDFNKGIDNESRKGPKRILQQNLLSKKEVLFFYAITVMITLLSGSLLCFLTEKPYFIALLLIGILLAYLYSGGPFPLSHYGAGEITAFIFFGPFIIINLYYLLNNNIGYEIFLLSIITGNLSAMIMLLNNYRDAEQDKKSNKITIANFSNHFFVKKIFPISLYTILFLIILFLTSYLNLNFKVTEWIFFSFPLPFFIFLMIKKKITSLFGLTLLWGIFIHISFIL